MSDDNNENMSICVNGKILRRGFTTGTCAAAASKAAAIMLLTGESVETVTVLTPKGISLDLDIEDIDIRSNEVTCAVRKDGGDDIDVTHGSLVYSKVTFSDGGIKIDGGLGVGRVTKKGLDQPVGNAAINRVPRNMIIEALEDVKDNLNYDKGFDVTISIPNGVELADKTFNPRLGIMDGVSVLGTSGIVEPMSEKAIMDTIKTEMKVRRAEGCETLLLVPGNYGVSYVEAIEGLDPEFAVKCSNYIGETLDYAVELGFNDLLLVGNLGKLVKLAGGIMNTHSKESDSRMEILAANAVLADASNDILRSVLGSVSTDDALYHLNKAHILDDVMKSLSEKAEYHMNRRVRGELRCGVVIFSSEYGLIGRSPSSDTLLKKLGGRIL